MKAFQETVLWDLLGTHVEKVTHTLGLFSFFNNEGPIMGPEFISLQPEGQHQQPSISPQNLAPEKLLG